jgi:hypothetical protein
MRRRVSILLGVCLTGCVMYVGTFSYWWLRSASYRYIEGGKRVHVVAFKWSKAYVRTEIMWAPAFLFVEHVLGYKRTGFVAMFEDSEEYYEKRER